MTKVIVDVISARKLKIDEGGATGNRRDPYLQLKVGNSPHANKQYTKVHKDVNGAVEFDEYFEFFVNEEDNLRVRLYEDNNLLDENVGEAKISLRDVVRTGKSLKSWFQLGEGPDFNGYVLLNIHTH